VRLPSPLSLSLAISRERERLSLSLPVLILAARVVLSVVPSSRYSYYLLSTSLFSLGVCSYVVVAVDR
jgi:hypothetical protein